MNLKKNKIEPNKIQHTKVVSELIKQLLCLRETDFALHRELSVIIDPDQPIKPVNSKYSLIEQTQILEFKNASHSFPRTFTEPFSEFFSRLPATLSAKATLQFAHEVEALFDLTRSDKFWERRILSLFTHSAFQSPQAEHSHAQGFRLDIEVPVERIEALHATLLQQIHPVWPFLWVTSGNNAANQFQGMKTWRGSWYFLTIDCIDRPTFINTVAFIKQTELPWKWDFMEITLS